MGILSKFIVQKIHLTTHRGSCYEMIHTWNANCNAALGDALVDAFLYALKTYLIFYGLSKIFSAKNIREIRWRNIITDALRSSVFLTTNLVIFLWLMCRMRKFLGFFTAPTLGLINGIASSLIAIFIEERKRRPTLALHLTNLASETAYHQLVNHGVLKYIPYGTVIVFGIGLSGLLNLYCKNKLSDSLTKTVNYALLMDETKELYSQKAFITMYSPLCIALLKLREQFGKHRLCQHKHSCVSRSVEAFLKNFSQGLIWSICLVILSRKGARNSAPFIKNLLDFRILRIPLFYGFLAFLFQSLRCGYSWLTNRKSPPLAVIGAISSLSLIFYPNASVSMYVLWKYIEAFFFAYCRKLIVPYGDVILYALSTGYVAWNAVIEPHTIRDGYWKFLVGLTGKRIELLNRRLFNIFGYDSSKKFPYYIPNVNSDFS